MNRTGLDYLNGAYADYSYDAASRLLVLDNQTNNGQLPDHGGQLPWEYWE